LNNFKTNIRQAALPNEHGSWGFVLEPLILSLIVAYSLPGLLLAFCTFFMFLSHQPIKQLFKKKKNNPYKKISIQFLIIYSTAIIILFAVILSMVDINTLIPFVLSLIIMLNYLIILYKQKNRELIFELSAPFSISLVALSILLFNNWHIDFVLAFWIILLARSVPTTFYVRSKLLLIKKLSAKNFLPILLGLLFSIILLITAALDYNPYLAAVASFILLIRAYYGLYVSKNKVKIRAFGIWEFIYGGLFIVITAVGYILNI